MRTLILITLACAHFSLAISQDIKDKWGDVTKEELTMTHYDPDPSANAVVLYNYGNYYFNRHYYFSAQELRTFYHYQVRLKILNDEGKKYATISIPFHGFDEYEDVVEISGTTYNLDPNGKIIKTKFKPKTIVWTRNGRDLWNCTFTMPDVKAGSVVEYTYKIASLDFVKLRDWMFQRDIPIVASEMVFDSPNFFQYGFFSNMQKPDLEVSRTDENQYIQFYTLSIYCSGTKLQLSARNTPAFHKEVWMPDSSRQILKGEFQLISAITRPSEFSNINDYYLMPYLKPLLLTTTEDYYVPRERLGLYTDIVGGYKIIRGMDWESFVKKLSKMDDFGKTLLKSFECKHLIDSFRQFGMGEKRMVAIYDYVKNYMKWNGEYRILASSSLEKIYEKKEGSGADINMLLINLLSRSGIQAKPVLISTRSFGNIYKELAFFNKFNHLIVSVELEGKRYLLDATDPLRPFSLLSLDDLNGEGLLVSNLDYKWVPLYNDSVSSFRQSENFNISGDGNLRIDLNDTITGYCALDIRKKALSEGDDSQTDSFKLINLKEESSPLIRRAVFTQTLNPGGDARLVFSPLTINSPVENPFEDEQRIYPIDLKFERSIIRKAIINIPEGYTIESFPQSMSFTMQENLLTFSITSVVVGNTLEISTDMEIQQSYIPQYYYADLKLFLSKIKDIEKEEVVMRRK